MIDREIHKILIPVDDSKMSDRAFDYGMDMAKLLMQRCMSFMWPTGRA